MHPGQFERSSKEYVRLSLPMPGFPGCRKPCLSFGRAGARPDSQAKVTIHTKPLNLIYH